MNKSKIALITVSFVAFGIGLNWLRTNIRSIPGLKNLDSTVISGIVIIIGIVAAAIIGWLVSSKFSSSGGSKGGAAETAQEQEITDLDDLLAEAEARLGEAQLQKDAKLSRLPAILMLGETGSAKSSTMIHSGLDPEQLAGQMYDENNLIPTPTANFWFSHRCVFIEMAGKTLGDRESLQKVAKALLPAKTAALVGAAKDQPRAALVCVDAETLLSPSPDPLAATAKKIRTQLSDLSQMLGINLPVYVLFTRTDRIPFFTEYVSKLNDEEATRILGATLPIVEQRRGVYAEEENSRINGVFERTFRSLCNARLFYLPREQANSTDLAAMYEFPREFRKIRTALVRFLVELGRPSQLNSGPFLRGFYFSGVRPIMVQEVAQQASQQAEQGGPVGATRMFRAASMLGTGAGAQRIVGTRKVPQWLFLGHFFNDLLLADNAAKSASASSVRASMPRRILLVSVAVFSLVYSFLLVLSYVKNNGLESRVVKASRGISAVDTAGLNAASLDSLQRLETLRQSLSELGKYNREGAPWSYRFGLYTGDALYPQVRGVYFAHFRRLLLLQTQNTIVENLRVLPGAPAPEYPYGTTYDSLKAYLITTSNHDKSTKEFLPPVLLNRWSTNRNVDPERMQLAQKQFEFYATELKESNPYPPDNDAAAIGRARSYLSQFAGVERVYQAILADAAKQGQPINFNRQFPGSAEVVIDNQEVAAPFTKPGATFVKNALKNPEKYFAGEAWVLGEQGAAKVDRANLAQQLSGLYTADFVKQWRAYLKAASVNKYASLPDAAKKLSVLSGNQSPLLALFWLASQNIPSDMPDILNALQPPTAVVPQSSTDRYIAPPNQSYMNAMVTLQASVEGVAAQPTGNEAGANQTLTNATQAKVAARQVAQTFRIDPEVHIEGVVQKLLEDPITNVEGLLRNLGPAELNGKGAGLCTQFRTVMNKFPFNPAAQPQATIADVNSIFHKPDGALWKFYDENLQKLMPKQGSQYVAASSGGTVLNPAFVAFFNQAAAFADAVYAGNTPDPHFNYTLKPVPSEGIQSVTLQLDGQRLSFPPDGAKQFTWQGSGPHEAKALTPMGGTPIAWSTSDGLWAIFVFFNKAEAWRPVGNTSVLEWIVRFGKDPALLPSGKPLTVRFELDMGNAPQVFQKGYFSRMSCVSAVAK